MSFQFGLGVLEVSATAGLATLGRLQNVTLNVSYENSQLRGGTDVFPINTQFFNGAMAGTIQYANIELSSLGRLLAGSGSVGGAGGSGTATFTALSKPARFQLRLSGVTNGITSTVTIDRVYIPNLALDFNRTDYTIPNLDFIVEADPSAPNKMATWVM